MKRRLLNVLTILSLLLCVAVVALWVRSHLYMDTVLLRPVAPEPGTSGPVSQASLGSRSSIVYCGRQQWTETPHPWGSLRHASLGLAMPDKQDVPLAPPTGLKSRVSQDD